MSNASRGEGAVHLLWTGGFDSTFRLMQLVLEHGRRVRPCYVIDTGRRSLGIEIKTMDRLKRRLFEEHPHARDLVLPTRYAHLDDLKPDPEIAEAFRTLHEATGVAIQAEWLARFCREYGLAGMEYGTHRGASVDRTIRPLTIVDDENGLTATRVDPAHAATPEGIVFGGFRFPIFDFLKSDMERMAHEKGWMGVLGRTWFCLRPRRRKKPCGHCGPCRLAVKQGMGWRIPWRYRIAGRLYLALRVKPIRRWLGRVRRSLLGGGSRVQSSSRG